MCYRPCAPVGTTSGGLKTGFPRAFTPGLWVLWLCARIGSAWAQPAAPQPLEGVTLRDLEFPVSAILADLTPVADGELRPSSQEVADLRATVLVEGARWNHVQQALAAALACEWQGGVLSPSAQATEHASRLAAARRDRFHGLAEQCHSAAGLSAIGARLLRDDGAARQAYLAGDWPALAAVGLPATDVDLLRSLPLGLFWWGGFAEGGTAAAQFVAGLEPQTLTTIRDSGWVWMQAWSLDAGQRNLAERALVEAWPEAQPLLRVQLLYQPGYWEGPSHACLPAGTLSVTFVGPRASRQFGFVPTVGSAGTYGAPPEEWGLTPPPSWPGTTDDGPDMARDLPLGTVVRAGSWPEALQFMHDQLDLDVVSDAFVRQPGPPPALRALPPRAATVREALNALCTAFGYRWATTGDVCVFQSAFWFEERTHQLAPSRATALRARVREDGALQWPDILSMADFGHLKRTCLARSLWPILNPTLPPTPALRLAASLGPPQIARAGRDPGLPFQELTAEQRTWLSHSLSASSRTQPPPAEDMAIRMEIVDGVASILAEWGQGGSVALERCNTVPPRR